MDPTKEQLKALRKSVNLSQEEFGKRLGVGKSAISYLESGRSNLTDQMIILICKEFNVNEDWLRTGEGEMFLEPDTFSLDEFVDQRDGTEDEKEIIKKIMKVYFELPKEMRTTIVGQFKKEFCLNSTEENAATVCNLFKGVPETPEEFEKAYPPLENDEEGIV